MACVVCFCVSMLKKERNAPACGWRMTGFGKVPDVDHAIVCDQSLRTRCLPGQQVLSSLGSA